MNALEAAGIAKRVLPRRLFRDALGGRFLYFPHKLPVALNAQRATFVFVQVEDETESAVRTWGAQHAALWTALTAAGRVFDRWMREPLASAAERETTAARLCEQARRQEEIESIKAAVAMLDHAVLAAYGGLNGAIARGAALATDVAAARGPKPLITTGRIWWSRRVPE